MVSAALFPVSRAARVTRDFRSCKTSTGRVRLQMMRSPSQWPASPRPSMVFGRSWIDARSLMASREALARAHSFVIEGAARTLDLMARSLPELFEGLIRPRDPAAIAHIQDSIGEAVARTQASAAEAKHERIVFLASEPDHGPLMRTLTRLRHDLVMIGLAAAEPLPESLQ